MGQINTLREKPLKFKISKTRGDSPNLMGYYLCITRLSTILLRIANSLKSILTEIFAKNMPARVKCWRDLGRFSHLWPPKSRKILNLWKKRILLGLCILFFCTKSVRIKFSVRLIIREILAKNLLFKYENRSHFGRPCRSRYDYKNFLLYMV